MHLSGHAESWHNLARERGVRVGMGSASDDLLVLGALWSSLLSRVFVRELRAIRETVERAVTGRCRHMAHGC